MRQERSKVNIGETHLCSYVGKTFENKFYFTFFIALKTSLETSHNSE